MSKDSPEGQENKILFELANIREQLTRIEVAGTGSQPEKTQKVPAIKVFIEHIGGERKPFVIKAEGLLPFTLRLSSIRTSIFLVLLLDLQDRLEGGPGLPSITDSISQTFGFLDPISADAEGAEGNIRVATYRFETFCAETGALRNKTAELYYSAEAKHFELLDGNGASISENVLVKVSTNESSVATAIQQACKISPFEQARREHSLFIPPGPSVDRLLLDMYDHDRQLQVTSLYSRPPLPSYPKELLDLIGAPDLVRQRQKCAFTGYKAGRFRFLEVLSEKTVVDLIRQSPSGNFVHYPPNVEAKHVQAHIERLIEILETFKHYNICTTRAPIPFVVVTYVIQSIPTIDHFTVFFDPFSPAHSNDTGCLVIHDANVCQAITNHIFESVITHPSTVQDRFAIIGAITRLRDYFVKEGPLQKDTSFDLFPAEHD